MPEVIKSASNEKIKRLRLLRGSAKERKKSGLFTAEGVKIFKEAPKEAVCETYVSESFARENACLLADCAFYTVEDGLFERICDTKTPQGIIPVFRGPSCRIEDLPENGPLIVVLENGSVSGFDTHEKLLESNSVYREIYDAQMSSGGDFDRPND